MDLTRRWRRRAGPFEDSGGGVHVSGSMGSSMGGSSCRRVIAVVSQHESIFFCTWAEKKCRKKWTHARTVPPCQPQPLQPPSSKFIIFRSTEGNRCFVHTGKVTRVIYSSIFAKKYIEKTLTIIGGGRGIKFEVANLENLS